MVATRILQRLRVRFQHTRTRGFLFLLVVGVDAVSVRLAAGGAGGATNLGIRETTGHREGVSPRVELQACGGGWICIKSEQKEPQIYTGCLCGVLSPPWYLFKGLSFLGFGNSDSLLRIGLKSKIPRFWLFDTKDYLNRSAHERLPRSSENQPVSFFHLWERCCIAIFEITRI